MQKRSTCCTLLMQLKLKWLLVILFFVLFHFVIYLLLRFCLSFGSSSVRSSDSALLNRGNVIYSDIDWHDYVYLLKEAKQKGPGEHGLPVATSSSEEVEVTRQMAKYGINAYLSNRIALNRSVADIRPADCRTLKYSATLPEASVIIVFNNEHLRSLLRTSVSVLNRSPATLLNEVILVDDASTFEELGAELDAYVQANEPKVKLIRLKERTGLIRARLAGARRAKSEVLIFLDAHCEANTNWLPPLLDPILKNYRRVMCPMIDLIYHNDFSYMAQDDGARGAFDWEFNYKRLPRFPSDFKQPAEPFKNPVMAGGLFAISAKFFWELGGYDEALDVYGGEQYELSFKIWMCGGEMYDAPCSRVGHIFRYGGNPHPGVAGDNLHHNYKRVAEVWMDEYKQYLYARHPEVYAGIDAGNLTKAQALRRKLQCKPFDWYIREIAFDLVKDYPPVEVFENAWGAVQSQSKREYCVKTEKTQTGQPLELAHCDKNVEKPTEEKQFFHLTWRSEIRLHNTSFCWDASSTGKDAPIVLYRCHHGRGNQFWRIDLKKNWIVHPNAFELRCVEFNPKTLKLVINMCDVKNKRMVWSFANINKTAIAGLT